MYNEPACSLRQQEKIQKKDVLRMPESGKWLTVSQFARLAGVSPQTIYKQLSTRLSTHSKQENGSKYINSDALQLFGVSTDSAGVDNSKQPGCQPGCQPDSAPEMEQMQQELDRIRAQLAQITADRDAAREQRDKAEIRAAAADAESKRADAAEAQLSVKDQQISAKDQQIQQQSDRIADLTAALRAAQDQNKELTTALTAAQALNAGTMQMLMEKAAPEPVTASQREDVPESIPTPQPQQEPLRSPQDVREDAAAPSGSEPQQRKPGLFARLFRKRK